MKKPWYEWAVEYVRRTKRCPGDIPPMGRPGDSVTGEQFQQSVASLGTHAWDDCHFVAEMLGSETSPEAALGDREIRLRSSLHKLVDRITFKNGKIQIPTELLTLREFIGTFKWS